MIYTFDELRHKLFADVYKVYDVFKDFFGEARVDLQNMPPDEYMLPVNVSLEDFPTCDITNEMLEGIKRTLQPIASPFILVYWPQVTVTNEHDKSIVIQDLYAKVQLDANGMIPVTHRGFLLNRATYPIEQWMSDYMHSHICYIPKNRLTEFQEPCLGTAPIKNVITSLKAEISEGFDEIKWMLFCQELSQCVQVESLAGRPYRYLEEVSSGTELGEYKDFTYNTSKASVCRFKETFRDDTLQQFIRYYLKNGQLTIKYQNGKYDIGLSHYEYIMDVSNTFIQFFNECLSSDYYKEVCLNRGVLLKVNVSNGKFYDLESRRIPNVSSYIGQKVCTFKGRDILLNIITGESQEAQETLVLSHELAMYIIQNIILIINYRYGNKTESTTASTTSNSKRVRYI